MLSFVACGAGIYIGLYFNVLSLLPFSVLGAGAYVASSWVSGQSLSLPAILFPLIAVQAGYMLGLTARETFGQLLARFNIGQSKRV